MTTDARPSYTSRVRAYLTARPGEWVSSSVLAHIGGACAWRTRTSEARLELEAAGLGTIENKLARPRDDDGNVIAVRSWYRFVPATPAQDTPSSFTPPASMPVYHGTYQRAPKAVRVDTGEGRLF